MKLRGRGKVVKCGGCKSFVASFGRGAGLTSRWRGQSIFAVGFAGVAGSQPLAPPLHSFSRLWVQDRSTGGAMSETNVAFSTSVVVSRSRTPLSYEQFKEL